jgi:hypothetical protein
MMMGDRGDDLQSRKCSDGENQHSLTINVNTISAKMSNKISFCKILPVNVRNSGQNRGYLMTQGSLSQTPVSVFYKISDV